MVFITGSKARQEGGDVRGLPSLGVLRMNTHEERERKIDRERENKREIEKTKHERAFARAQ